ncbi:hypothetical protein AVEN_7613-1 [Araneus ventricosus]|uniref:Uncharacterized protein n=1 Tax=Araneus ventricosus TaxID=182803 RepID=A0A4Y2N165_ARAVE|nr:hypothetical protein AVEN_7613-1 [Araneus ventricosus]
MALAPLNLTQPTNQPNRNQTKPNKTKHIPKEKMPNQPATLFTISAVQTGLCVGTRHDLYFLDVPRTVFVRLMASFEATRCLQYHRHLPLSIYFDAERNCEIVLPDNNHRCDERFDWDGEIMENEFHFHD